jgi:hypothetical protein
MLITIQMSLYYLHNELRNCEYYAISMLYWNIFKQKLCKIVSIKVKLMKCDVEIRPQADLACSHCDMFNSSTFVCRRYRIRHGKVPQWGIPTNISVSYAVCKRLKLRHIFVYIRTFCHHWWPSWCFEDYNQVRVI